MWIEYKQRNKDESHGKKKCGMKNPIREQNTQSEELTKAKDERIKDNYLGILFHNSCYHTKKDGLNQEAGAFYWVCTSGRNGKEGKFKRNMINCRTFSRFKYVENQEHKKPASLCTTNIDHILFRFFLPFSWKMSSIYFIAYSIW